MSSTHVIQIIKLFPSLNLQPTLDVMVVEVFDVELFSAVRVTTTFSRIIGLATEDRLCPVTSKRIPPLKWKARVKPLLSCILWGFNDIMWSVWIRKYDQSIKSKSATWLNAHECSCVMLIPWMSCPEFLHRWTMWYVSFQCTLLELSLRTIDTCSGSLAWSSFSGAACDDRGHHGLIISVGVVVEPCVSSLPHHQAWAAYCKDSAPGLPPA